MSTNAIRPVIKSAFDSARGFAAWLFPTWTYRVCFAFVCLCAFVLCFVPLFNLVGYESAAFFGVLSGLMGTGLTLHAHRMGLVEGPVSRERLTSPTRDFALLLGRHTPFVLVPLMILSLNALRVRNCDFVSGFGFWALIPPFSLAIGQALSWGALSLTPGKRYLYRTIAFGAAALSGLSLLWHLAIEPPIVGFQWWMGYFGGSIYDEAMAIDPALLFYRLLNLGMFTVLLLSVEIGWRRRQGRGISKLVILGVCVGILTALGWSGRKERGIDIDRAHIISALGGVLETEHYVIHYPLREPFVSQLDLLAEDHEFRYAQMKAFFETDPVASSGRKVRSFVYADRDSKGFLMGARNTLIAKLWLHEMHILWRGYGDHVLAHELAHIFTEPFGKGPLRLSMQAGIGVNMGLVEGIATAADWPTAELTPHEASAALRRDAMAPDIRRLVGASGFWTQASGRAYTLMGSFVRYLVDTYGIGPFKIAYGAGDFEGAYGKSAHALVGEWEEFLDGLELTSRQIDVARYLYNRPSIFGKVCARTVAELWRQSQEAVASGDLVRARQIFERILENDPSNVQYHLAYARYLMRNEAVDEALEIVLAQLSGPLEPVREAELLAMVGDLQWNRGRLLEADQAYGRCLEIGLPVDLERSMTVKRASLGHPDQEIRRLAYHYLLDPKPGAHVGTFFIMEWFRREEQSPLANYLVGRRLWDAGQWEWALPFLERSEGQMESEILDAEALRMLGQAYYFVDRLDEAKRRFTILSEHEVPRYREQGREWLERVAWKTGWNRDVSTGG